MRWYLAGWVGGWVGGDSLCALLPACYVGGLVVACAHVCLFHPLSGKQKWLKQARTCARALASKLTYVTRGVQARLEPCSSKSDVCMHT